MTSQADIVREAVAPRTVGGRLSGVLARVWGAITTWVENAVDYHAAAATYDALRTLSDAELCRRGLSRTTLARDVCAMYERAER
jgi:hypothetical protein